MKFAVQEVAIIRKIVDNEDCIPSTIGGKQMGKALLSFFIDLPTPLIPVSVAKTVSQSKLSKELAASLTQEAMTAVEWGVMRTTLEVFRTALTPEHAAVNNLTISSLASVLADVWFRSKELEPGEPLFSLALHVLLSSVWFLYSTASAISSNCDKFIHLFLSKTEFLLYAKY